MNNFDFNPHRADIAVRNIAKVFDSSKDAGIELTYSERANILTRIASLCGVPATIWSPADLVARSTNWTDDEMTEAEVAPHRERAAKAYELLPRLMQKADQDYSVVDWALALAEDEGE